MAHDNNNRKEKTPSDAQYICSLPTDQYPFPNPHRPPFQITPPVYLLGGMSCGVERPFGHFGSSIPSMLPPSFFCFSQAQHETRKKKILDF